MLQLLRKGTSPVGHRRVAAQIRPRPGFVVPTDVEQPGSGPVAYAATLALFVFLAFALHVWRLGGRDFWGDELASLSLALDPLQSALTTLATSEPHPPLYTVVLHYWTRLAGIGEFAVRFPSLACGVAAVPITAAIGRRFGGRFAGLVAAGIVVLSPLVQWYSQEARMYAPLLLFSGWATYELPRALVGERWGRTRYLLALLMASYSHYYGLALGLSHALVVLAWLVRQHAGSDRSASIRYWLPVAGAVAVGYAPWLIFAGRIVMQYQGVAPGQVDVLPVARDVWLRLALGWSVEPPAAWLVAVPILLLALLGAVTRLAERDERARLAGTSLVVSVAGPVAFGALVSLIRPMYAERYLVVGLVPFCGLVALGVDWLWRWRRLAALLGLVLPVAFLGSLQNDAADPLYQKSDYGRLGQIERALRVDGERVLLVGGSQYYLHWYYGAGGGEPVIGPEVPPFDPVREAPRLDALLADARGVWLYLYALPDYDPTRLAERWADETFLRGDHYWASNAELIYYSAFDGRFETRLRDLNGPGISVDRFEVGAGAYRSGAAVPVRIAWRAAPPPGVQIALRIVDAQGMLWGQLDTPVRASQAEALRPGYAVRLLPGAPPGEYRLRAQLYGPNGPMAITIDGQESRDFDLGPILVDRFSKRFDGGMVPAFRPIGLPVAGGATIGVSGGEVGNPGGSVFVFVAWQSSGDDGPLPARFVLGSTGVEWPVRWRVTAGVMGAGDVVVVQQNLDVPADVKPGRYHLDLVDVDGRRASLGIARIGVP